MKKTPLYSIVEIEWVDSCHENGWRDLAYYDWESGQKVIFHISVGYFVKETKDAVCIVQSRQKFVEPPSVDALMMIPKCAIKSYRILAGQ